MKPPRWLDIPVGFYAVRDPRSPEKVTCWRRDGKANTGRFGCWPTEAWRTLKGDLDMSGWLDYGDQVADLILSDLDGSRARFSAFATRCFLCGRALRSKRWKLYGVGPECGGSFSRDELGFLAEFMATASGSVLTENVLDPNPPKEK